MTYTPTYYEVLDLPEGFRDDPILSAQTLRNAYRRALLQNHPDKATQSPVTGANFSIDQISEAFSILADRKARAEYDKKLKKRVAEYERGVKGRELFRTGIETVDLDDLENEELQGIWYRSCRCGDGRGFLIRESDLEEAAEDGEISVGCRGCSLWLKVLFGVMEEAPPDKLTIKLESQVVARLENSPRPRNHDTIDKALHASSSPHRNFRYPGTEAVRREGDGVLFVAQSP